MKANSKYTSQIQFVELTKESPTVEASVSRAKVVFEKMSHEEAHLLPSVAEQENLKLIPKEFVLFKLSVQYTSYGLKWTDDMRQLRYVRCYANVQSLENKKAMFLDVTEDRAPSMFLSSDKMKREIEQRMSEDLWLEQMKAKLCDAADNSGGWRALFESMDADKSGELDSGKATLLLQVPRSRHHFCCPRVDSLSSTTCMPQANFAEQSERLV